MINFLKRLYFNIVSTFILIVATLTGKIANLWLHKKPVS